MALNPPVSPPNPLSVTFYRWTAFLCEALASYNVPSPVDEGSWQTWATTFCSIPEVQACGLPNPQIYDDWRKWAMMSIPLLE